MKPDSNEARLEDPASAVEMTGEVAGTVKTEDVEEDTCPDVSPISTESTFDFLLNFCFNGTGRLWLVSTLKASIEAPGGRRSTSRLNRSLAGAG